MDVIDVALKEVGTTEWPAKSNQTKYGKWFGYDGVMWCAIFVSWCFAATKRPLGNIGYKKGFAGCQTGIIYFREKGWVTTSPVRGDIVFFDWNKDGRYDHVGLYYEPVDKDSFKTIEGNTSLTNQSNGGQVMIRERFYKNAVFVHVP